MTRIVGHMNGRLYVFTNWKPADHIHSKYFFSLPFRASLSHSKHKNETKKSESVCLFLFLVFIFQAFFLFSMCCFKLENERNEMLASAASNMLLRRFLISNVFSHLYAERCQKGGHRANVERLAGMTLRELSAVIESNRKSENLAAYVFLCRLVNTELQQTPFPLSAIVFYLLSNRCLKSINHIEGLCVYILIKLFSLC